MFVVYKYNFNDPHLELPLHKYAVPLLFDEQGGRLKIWIGQDTSQPIVEKRIFFWVGTGQELRHSQEELVPIGSVVTEDEEVYHAFELITADTLDSVFFEHNRRPDA